MRHAGEHYRSIGSLSRFTGNSIFADRSSRQHRCRLHGDQRLTLGAGPARYGPGAPNIGIARHDLAIDRL
jgi:hypothetical protein